MIKSAELENSAYEFEAKMPLRHAVPLESLQDVFAVEELFDFDERVRAAGVQPVYVVEYKIDGRAVSSQTCR